MKKLTVSVIFVYLALALMAPGLALVSCDSNTGGGGTTTAFTVRFDPNGGNGTGPDPITVNAGSSVILPNDSGFYRTGYAFGGWNTEPDGTGTNYSAGASCTPAGDVTLYARWDPVPPTTSCIVNFHHNGGTGTGPGPITVNAGSSIYLPNGNGLSMNEHTFGGWNTKHDGTGHNYSAGASYTVSGNITLYARWDLVTKPVSPGRIEYYWVDQHGSLVTTGGGVASINTGETLTITAQGAGYVVKQWLLNGINTGQNGNTYNFSSVSSGKHIVGLFVEKDGNPFNTNITITVR